MTAARSMFTEAIEDHLALKRQNAHLEGAMPLARFDLGDPLDHYPGGPGRAAGDAGTVLVPETAASAAAGADGAAHGMTVGAAPVAGAPVEPSMGDATQVFAGPSPEQAMEAATALEPAFGDRPFEPLAGMAPMLSLVEDIDEDDEPGVSPTAFDAMPPADVLRFPGGVGPRRDEEPAATVASAATDLAGATQLAAPVQTTLPEVVDALTGEQPVLVIDTDEPLAPSDRAREASASRGDRRRPRFFGLGRKKSQETQATEGWFTDGPRDFNWD